MRKEFYFPMAQVIKQGPIISFITKKFIFSRNKIKT